MKSSTAFLFIALPLFSLYSCQVENGKEQPVSADSVSDSTTNIIDTPSCPHPNIQTDKEIWNYKGKVKSVRTLCYDADRDSAGNIVRGKPMIIAGAPDILEEFDTLGNYIRNTWRNLDGSLDFRESYVRDSVGQLVMVFHTLPESWRNWTEYFNYDKCGYRANEYSITKKDTVPGVHHFYDEKGYCIKDSCKSYIRYLTYDSAGNKLNDSTVHLKEKFDLWKQQFDSRKRPLSYIAYYDGAFFSRTEFTYRDSAELCVIESIEYRPDGRVMEHEFIYKDKFDNQVLRRLIFTDIGSSHTEWKAVYTYDKNGNWIRRVDYEDGWVVSIQECTITYY